MAAVELAGIHRYRVGVQRHWSGNLELVDHREGPSAGAQLGDMAQLARNLRRFRPLPGCVLVIDDEDSRNTSGTAVRVRRRRRTSVCRQRHRQRPSYSEVTIECGSGSRNRSGVECFSASLKCRNRGMKPEITTRRRAFRHTAGVSKTSVQVEFSCPAVSAFNEARCFAITSARRSK